MCQFTLVILLHCLVGYSFQVVDLPHHNVGHDDIIVTLDPYVSILDKYNNSRYSDSQLMDMLSIVSTEYSRLHIQLKKLELYRDLKTSLSLLPSTVAKFNLKHNLTNSTTPFEVWLSIQEHSLSHTNIKYITKKLVGVANKANAIFNGTVTTLVLPFTLFSNRMYGMYTSTTGHQDLSFPGYKWGIIHNKMYSGSCSDRHQKEKMLKLEPDLILISVTNMNEYTAKGTLPETLNGTLHQCQFEKENSIEMGILTSCPDTEVNGKKNMSQLISCWTNLRNWARHSNKTVILNQAFDTPNSTEEEEQLERKTAGWWHHLEDVSLLGSNFSSGFQAKKDIFKELDVLENTINISRLEENATFKSEHLGVVFSLFDQDRPPSHSDEEASRIALLTNLLSYNFGKAMVLFDCDSKSKQRSTLTELRSLSKVKGQLEIIALLMPKVNIQQYFDSSIEEAGTRHGVTTDLVTTFVLPLTPHDENRTRETSNFVKNIALGSRNSTTYKLGYSMLISDCGNYWKWGKKGRNVTDEFIREAEVVYFYFEEEPETVKLGARRMFSQRIVLLEHCRKFVDMVSQSDSDTGGGSKEVAFLMTHYGVRPQSFYSDPLAMYNFVIYWEMLSDWAIKTKTTIILSNLIDSTRILPGDKIPIQELGWWRQRPVHPSKGAETWSRDEFWIDKRTEALTLSLQIFPRPEVRMVSTTTPSSASSEGTKPNVHSQSNRLDTLEIILVAAVPLVLSATVSGIIIWLIRRHYVQSYFMSSTEMRGFFNGSGACGDGDLGGESSAHCLPYDKIRYEIPNGTFTVDENNVLGKGEFGVVLKGKMRKNEEDMNVAIKTVNMERFRKTALNDLLTEIKVLAYVEEHVNIVRLLGANTSGMKRGKVYVFLELCEFGSLDKFLRGIRPPPCGDEEEQDDENEAEYSETKSEHGDPVTQNMSLLDPLILQDLDRWSAEIADGMRFLASKKVVHADLATRNVLLNLKMEAKISDFGLSRKIYNYTNYVKQQQDPLPWRWMPPESLRLLQFNEKSDVWAYGVTLWEMYTLGDQPYPGLSYDVNFPQLLERGLRLSKPQYSNEEMYNLMKDCWHLNRNRRPTFAELVERFKSASNASDVNVKEDEKP